MAALSLRCCARAFSSCLERGLLFIAVRRLLVVVASRCGARALGARASVLVACGLSSCGSRALERRRSSCGAWAQLPRGMWDLPGPGIEPMSPALAGRFLTTAPPGKSPVFLNGVTMPMFLNEFPAFFGASCQVLTQLRALFLYCAIGSYKVL